MLVISKIQDIYIVNPSKQRIYLIKNINLNRIKNFFIKTYWIFSIFLQAFLV
jgi:hypothetical protein